MWLMSAWFASLRVPAGGELLGRVKICTAIKLRLAEKVVHFCVETASPVLTFI